MTYSSSLAQGRQRMSMRNRNTLSMRAQDRTIGPISNTIILVVLACLLGLLYLTQVTKTNTLSYTVNDYREKQTSLKAEHDQLEVDSARLQALDKVKNSTVAKNLVTVAPSATLQN